LHGRLHVDGQSADFEERGVFTDGDATDLATDRLEDVEGWQSVDLPSGDHSRKPRRYFAVDS
jgi:hypothetical protein